MQILWAYFSTAAWLLVKHLRALLMPERNARTTQHVSVILPRLTKDLPRLCELLAEKLFNNTVAQPFIIPFPHYEAFMNLSLELRVRLHGAFYAAQSKWALFCVRASTAIIHNIVL